MTCLVAFVDVTKPPAPRDSVVLITDDWMRDLEAPDVIKGRTTGTRDVPPRLITTGPEVEVRMIASPGLPDRPSVTLAPEHSQVYNNVNTADN